MAEKSPVNHRKILNKGTHPSDHTVITFLMPILFLIGAYLIKNGYVSPGGGFQGGAVLAAIFISHYLILPKEKKNTDFMQKFEKYVFLTFIVFTFIYILLGFRMTNPEFYIPYLMFMNFLIGMKVFCGMSIIFIHFVLDDE